MDYARIIREKVVITGRMIDGEELWRAMADQSTRYSAARSPGGGSLIRYYGGRGTTLIPRSAFKPLEMRTWYPSSDWIVRFAIRNTGLNHVQIVEKSRTSDVFVNAHIDRVVVRHKISTSLSVELWDSIELSDITYNYVTGGFTVRGTVDRNVSMEEDVESTCRGIRPQLAEVINALKFSLGGRTLDLASSPIGQELLDYLFGLFIGAVNLDHTDMKHIRERFAHRLTNGVSIGDANGLVWSQEAYRIITNELWDNMMTKPVDVDHEMFVQRACREHVKVEYITETADHDPMSRLNILRKVKYNGVQLEGEDLIEHVVNNILNAPYWSCGDSRSNMIFLDFRIGLYNSEDDAVKRGETIDELELLNRSKNANVEQELREIVIQRWRDLC